MCRLHSTCAEAWNLYRDEVKVDVYSRLKSDSYDHSHAVNGVFLEPAVVFEAVR